MSLVNVIQEWLAMFWPHLSTSDNDMKDVV